MSAREPKLQQNLEGVGPAPDGNLVWEQVSQVNLKLPCEQSRRPQSAGMGHQVTRHLISSRLSLTVWTRETSWRMRRRVGS